MALLLHGLVAARTPPSTQPAGHWLLPVGALAAIVSDHDVALTQDSATEADIITAALRHNDILMAYVTDQAVVPVRYGAVFTSPEAVLAHISAGMAAYQRALYRLEGCAEYAIALSSSPKAAPADASPPPQTGRAFLQARLTARATRQNEARNRRSFAGALLNRLGHTVSATRHAPQPKPGRLIDASLLVSKGQHDDLIAVAKDAAETAATLGLKLTITGPLPPYSFATDLTDERPEHVA